MAKTTRKTPSRPPAPPQMAVTEPALRAGATAKEAFDAAVRHHLAGEQEEAEASYRGLLARFPDFAEAHNNLGVLIRSHQPDQALHHFREAVRLLPTYEEGLINLGLALLAHRELEEAERVFRAATEAHPANAAAHNNLGLVLRELGQAEASLPPLHRAVELKPGDPAAHNNLGNAFLELGHIDRAIACYERALEAEPSYVEAINNLGGAYRAKRNFPEAIRLFRRALELRPDYPDALHNLALALPPDLETARENQAILRYAVERNPSSPKIRAILATALQEMGMCEEARTEARAVLELDPDNAEAWTALGICAANDLDFEEAIRCYERTLALRPRDTSALWNHSLALLALGDYERGWAEYESRWQLVHFGLDRRHFDRPTWDGSSLDGRTILLYTEQGLGDGIQFVRFAKVIKERWSTRIVIEAAPLLVPLFRSCPWIDEVFPRGEQRPPFDVQAPLLSLPGILGVTLDTLPAEPYLEARPRPVASRIREGNGLKVGLVWGGGTPTPTLAWRSMQLAALENLAAIEGVQLYSLQKGDAAAQLESCAFRDRIVDLGPDLHDFTDTAAAIAALDLVISIDTSVAHLAGALGTPVWVLLIHAADWRWLLDRTDSPWYPSARLFRQSVPGNWETVVAEVRERLAELAADPGRAPSAAPAPAGEEAGWTSLPSAQKDRSGRPRFTLSVPMAALAEPARFARFQDEIAGDGVDAEARAFLDDELESGDILVDVGAGWGFTALSAATAPASGVRVFSIVDDAGDEEVLRRSASRSALNGTLRIVRADDLRMVSMDRLAPLAQARSASRLFLRVSADADVASTLAGVPEWLSSGRLAGVIWEPSAGVDPLSPPDAIVAGSLEAFGYRHFRMTVDAAGPLLVPWETADCSGPVFSLSAPFLERNTATERAEKPEPAAAPATHRATGPSRIGVDWQVGTASGWGVYGLNLVRRALETDRAFPLLFTPPDLRSLSPARIAGIDPALQAHRELTRQAAGPGSTFNAPFPILRALGNRLLGGAAGVNVVSPRNVGVIFFEDTHLDAEALARGSRFDRIIAGSTWNADVLRGCGLERVHTCLQGVDTTVFHPAPATGRFGDRFVVFSGGKLEYRKGQDIVVAAFREFQRRHPEALLITAWHNHWPATMAEIGLRGHVRGVPGVLPDGRTDIAGWLRSNGLPDGSFLDLGVLANSAMGEVVREAHVALFPNRCEGGTNLVAMECMASGVPTILSANTGHLDLLRGDSCFPLRDQTPALPSRQFVGTEGWGESSVDEILDLLELVHADREEAGRRGEIGAREIGRLSWDRQIDALLDALGDLL